MRQWFLFLISLVLIADAVGQYQIMLEVGDTLVVNDYQEKGDTIVFSGGRIGKADVLCIVGGSMVYEYPLPKMKPYMVRKAYDGSPCGRAKQFARKYAKVDLKEYVIHDPSVDSLSQQEWDFCFGEELIALGVDPGEHLLSDPLVRVTSNTDVTSPVDLIILRTGDTLRIEKGVFLARDVLNWNGGGSTDPAEVLLVVRRTGQHVVNCKGQFSKLSPQVLDLSPCASGVIYANIYRETADVVSEIPCLPPNLRNDDSFAECYYRRHSKFVKRDRTLRTLRTIGHVTRAGNTMTSPFR